jgi:hypothetical protein
MGARVQKAQQKMDATLFENLLYRDESETLDFKVEQYPFDGATDDQKSELLKDLLAFANAWRTAEAYILAGVKEKRGGRSIVLGVGQHLLNRNLQQFVHSKTNRPLAFSYSGFRFEEHDVGIIGVPVQDRPLYLLKDFGQLKANVVYIRRVDSTGIAAPDEVFKMGLAAGSVRQEPALNWEFVNPANRERLGLTFEVESRNAVTPPSSSIPQYGRSPEPFSIDVDPMINRDYLKELAEWVRQTMPLVPLGIAITNAATVAAEDVVLALQFDSSKVVAVADSEVPLKPSRGRLPPIRPLRPHDGRQVEVSEFGSVYEVRAPLGTVQPGTTAWSPEPFYIGAQQTTSIRISATVSANNLSTPITSSAEISVKAVPRKISVEDIVAFSRSHWPA